MQKNKLKSMWSAFLINTLFVREQKVTDNEHLKSRMRH